MVLVVSLGLAMARKKAFTVDDIAHSSILETRK